jgi:O-acetyl-ADP-ribose deacetylase (regulator of RNase III)
MGNSLTCFTEIAWSWPTAAESAPLPFLSISTGVYGYPIEQAVGIAFNTVLAHSATVVEGVRFVLFSEHDLRVCQQEMDRRGL